MSVFLKNIYRLPARFGRVEVLEWAVLAALIA